MNETMTLGLIITAPYDRLDLSDKEHDVIVRKVADRYQATCDFLWCTFDEEYETEDEATDGATGHETVME